MYTSRSGNDCFMPVNHAKAVGRLQLLQHRNNTSTKTLFAVVFDQFFLIFFSSDQTKMALSRPWNISASTVSSLCGVIDIQSTRNLPLAGMMNTFFAQMIGPSNEQHNCVVYLSKNQLKKHNILIATLPVSVPKIRRIRIYVTTLHLSETLMAESKLSSWKEMFKYEEHLTNKDKLQGSFVVLQP